MAMQKRKASPFAHGDRGERGVARTPIHVLLTLAQRKKLVALSRKAKLTASDVVRTLIEQA